MSTIGIITGQSLEQFFYLQRPEPSKKDKKQYLATLRTSLNNDISTADLSLTESLIAVAMIDSSGTVQERARLVLDVIFAQRPDLAESALTVAGAGMISAFASTREASIRVLAAITFRQPQFAETTIPIMKAATEDCDAAVRVTASREFTLACARAQKQEVVSEWRNELLAAAQKDATDSSAQVRKAAQETLQRVTASDPEFSGAVLAITRKAIIDEDGEVCCAAMRTLRAVVRRKPALADVEVFQDVMLMAIGDANLPVRSEAQHTLGTIVDGQFDLAVRALTSARTAVNKTPPDWQIREAAQRTVQVIIHKVPALIDAELTVDVAQVAKSDLDMAVRKAAEQTLDMIAARRPDVGNLLTMLTAHSYNK